MFILIPKKCFEIRSKLYRFVFVQGSIRGVESPPDSVTIPQSIVKCMKRFGLYPFDGDILNN